jgi:Insertion element 4 transposase N-terminal/Transposase DDE domain
VHIPEPQGIGEALAYLSRVVPNQFESICNRLEPDWIQEALRATGTATVRRRRLPAEQVVWLVLGMALMRGKPIVELVDRLDLALPGSGTKPVAASAVAQARARLGSDPIEWLFLRSAHEWAHASAAARPWRGLAVYGVDGSTLRVPDSSENRTFFGGQSGRKETDSGYPLVRIAMLMAVRSHVVAGASFGPYDSEHVYARDLWPSVPPDSVVLVDRGFFAASILIPLQDTGRHWVTRAQSRNKWTTLERLSDGDTLVEMEVSSRARAADPSLPKSWRMRAIRYQRRGFPPQTVLTSLVDAKAYPKKEIVALYHERWELEIGHDELKTDMLAREETIRSQSPAMVAQELWGLLLAYNLVRLEMERIADLAEVEPTRISFVAALRFVCDAFHWLAVTRSPGTIPAQLADLRTRLARFVLPERRPRSNPRAVKIKMSGYPRKRPSTDGAVK